MLQSLFIILYVCATNKCTIIASQIANKHKKSLEIVKRLNIANREYADLERKWAAHVEMVSIPATAAGVDNLIKKAEKQTNPDLFSH